MLDGPAKKGPDMNIAPATTTEASSTVTHEHIDWAIEDAERSLRKDREQLMSRISKDQPLDSFDAEAMMRVAISQARLAVWEQVEAIRDAANEPVRALEIARDDLISHLHNSSPSGLGHAAWDRSHHDGLIRGLREVQDLLNWGGRK